MRKAVDGIEWQVVSDDAVDRFTEFVTSQPPDAPIGGLWFGMYDASHADADLVSLYVWGFPTFAFDADWMVHESWTPKSGVIATDPLTRIHRWGEHNRQHWNEAVELCEAWSAHLARRCTESAVAALGYPLGTASGYDSGEPIIHGRYNGQRWNLGEAKIVLPASVASTSDGGQAYVRIGNADHARIATAFATMRLDGDIIVAGPGQLPDYHFDRVRDHAFVSPPLAEILTSGTHDLTLVETQLVNATGDQQSWYRLEFPAHRLDPSQPVFMAPIEPPTLDATVDSVWGFMRLVVAKSIAEQIEDAGLRGFAFRRCLLTSDPPPAARQSAKPESSHCRIGTPDQTKVSAGYADLQFEDSNIVVAGPGKLPHYHVDHSRECAYVSPQLQAILTSRTHDLRLIETPLINDSGDFLPWFRLEFPERDKVAFHRGGYLAPIDPPAVDATVDTVWSTLRLVVINELAQEIADAGIAEIQIRPCRLKT